ncbi:MAG: (2Fe-2S)-binding protein [Deltaproteobacteria bacterium RBG_13_53_10]|nr:MAG: (2Fe-2S)-binding protein [Deltaproteobacteria bacterium RBG_13_53_10]
MDSKEILLIVNGEVVAVDVRATDTLVDVLRDTLGLTGTKKSCGTGECGACTVLLDGKPVNSCLILAMDVEGRTISTIEGLEGADGTLHPIQEAFLRNGAVQCGFCTPGMILSAKALLDERHHPTEEEVRRGLAGNLCRCTGYAKIVQAVLDTAREMFPKG